MPNFDKDQDRTSEPRWADSHRFNRIRDAVYKEVIHQAWGCALWGCERLGHIKKEQRMAGDEYFKAYHASRRSWEGEIKHQASRDHYKDLWEVLGGRGADLTHIRSDGKTGTTVFKMPLGEPYKERRAVHELVIEELYPVTEVDKRRVRNGLIRLQYFLRIGTK